MSRSRELLGDSITLIFGSMAARLLGLILLPFYTYSLTRSEFGAVDLAVAGLDLALPLLFLGISEAVLRFGMAKDRCADDVLRTGLSVVGLGSVAAAAFATLLLFWLPAATVGLMLSILILQACLVVLGAWGRAQGQVRSFAISGIVQAVGVGVGNLVLLAVFDAGVVGFLLSLCLGNLAACIFLTSRLSALPAIRRASMDLGLLKQMLVFSVPLVPNALAWWVTNLSGRYVLAVVESVAAVGLFAAAARIPTLVNVVTTVFLQAWQLSANKSSLDVDRGQFYSLVFRHYAGLLTLVVSVLVIAARPVVGILFAPEYGDAWRVVVPLLWGALFAGFASFYGAIYTAQMQTKQVFWSTIAAAGISAVLNVLLIPTLGVAGAGLAVSLCFLSLWLVRVHHSQRLVRTSTTPRRLSVALGLLALQSGLVYTDLSGRVLAAVLPWTVLALLLMYRRELRTIWQQTLDLRTH